MNSYQILKYGYLCLFVLSIPLFFFYIRPGQFGYESLFMSVLLTLPATIYLWVRVHFITEFQVTKVGYFTNTAPIVVALLGFVVGISLVSMDISDLKISRNFEREMTVYIRLINLHIVLFLFACIYHFSRKSRGLSGVPIILFVCFCLSMFIALMEGRRTSILIPILLLGLFSVTTSLSGSIKKKLFIYTVLFVVVFMVVTVIRTGVDFDVARVFRAILSRLFNPGHMVLAIMEKDDFSFDPQTLENIVERVGYTFGLNDYSGNTRKFGVHYGFIRENVFVGINPGLVVESFLAFGILGYILQIVIFESTFILIKMFRGILFRADLFVILLILHGMQMEIPYTFGVIAKLFVLGALISGFKALTPSKLVANHES